MRRIAAVLLVLTVACRANAPATHTKTEVTSEEDVPRAAVNPHQWGPYAYDPSWQDMKESYLAVTEIDFGAGHRLEECTGEFSPSVREHPDTMMFVAAGTRLTVRNPYGDAFHAHWLGADQDVLILSKDGRLETQGREGLLVLVTSPYAVDSAVSKSIVPPTTMTIRLRKSEEAEALLSVQPFAAVAKSTDGALIYITSQPHNEAEAIYGVYDPGRTQSDLLRDAKFTHGPAILLPRFVIDAADGGKVWQRVGTYPYPPDLAPDAAGTQFIGLEVKKDAAPFQVVTAGRPVVSVPAKPVATRADVFMAFYGLAEKGTYTFVSSHGYAAHPKPVMKVEAKEVKERTTAASIDLSGEPEGERTVFLLHRLVARWKESGGMRGAQDEAKAAALYDLPKDRPVIRSNANGFLKQLKFLGKTGGAGGEMSSIVPGSMISDLTSGMTASNGGGNPPQLPSWNSPGTTGGTTSTSTNSTSSTNVTNVYINVTHDDAMSSLAGGLPYTSSYVGPNTLSWRPESARLPTGATAGPAALRNQMMGKNDPYGNYYYDPRTNGVWKSPYSGGAHPAESRGSGLGYDPINGGWTFGPQIQFESRRKRGW